MAAYCILQNFGKTPAFIQSIRGSLDIISPPNRELYHPTGEEPYGGSTDLVIPPGEKSSPIQFVGNPITLIRRISGLQEFAGGLVDRCAALLLIL